MSKLNILNNTLSFEQKKELLEEKSLLAEQTQPNQKLKTLPKMVGITPDTAKGLKTKAFKYILGHDKDRKILKAILKHPLRYTFRYLTSIFKKKNYHRKEDLFFYGVKSKEAFINQCKRKNAHLVVGFSYCQKPHECPSGRFTDKCIRDFTNPICAQCDIGKLCALAPKNSSLVMIPTVHDIGNLFFDLVHKEPDKEHLFVITACEMTLTMFADFGNMLALKGIGIRLDGRICNTMRAFDLSERGVKPGLTVLRSKTYDQMLELFKDLEN